MNIDTWNRLADAEKQEINLVSKQFIASVMGSGTLDGWDFCNKFEVREIDDNYCVVEKSTGNLLMEHKSKSKNVMEALYSDAVQNFGR